MNVWKGSPNNGYEQFQMAAIDLMADENHDAQWSIANKTVAYDQNNNG